MTNEEIGHASKLVGSIDTHLTNAIVELGKLDDFCMRMDETRHAYNAFHLRRDCMHIIHKLCRV